MSEVLEEGVRAGDLKIGQAFKRESPDSKGYTLYRIEPEDRFDQEIMGKGCILALGHWKIYDIHESEIVYPVTDRNRTNW